MGVSEWLAVAQVALTGVVALLVWVWGRYRDLALIIRRLDEIERRLDHAGKRTSDLASAVQTIPTRVHAEARPELDRMWASIDQIRGMLLGRGV